jgi:hypothetical protein
VIPSSILGVALAAAALGPGYVYVRVARQKKPRGNQSQAAELVEMLVIGALASVVAGGIILVAGKATDFLDTDQLAADFNAYLLTEPARSFGSLVAFYGLAYFGAWVAANIAHHGDGDFTPDGSAWYQAFAEACPADAVPFLTIELCDGRWIAGAYQQATVERDDNRELCLRQPLGRAVAAGERMQPISGDEFILIRENDIRLIQGRYLRSFPTTDERQSAAVEPRVK